MMALMSIPFVAAVRTNPERFVMGEINWSSHQPFMRTSGLLLESDFRAKLSSVGLSPDAIEATIQEARVRADLESNTHTSVANP
jgi:hypothetical protein